MKTTEAIAIVGMGCRFPGGANDPNAYWELLINGIDAISEVPEDRWNLRSHFNEDKTKPGKTYTRCGGFIKDIDKFDADFFGVSPREAACMDPQQRILLETTWEAFADAGIDPERLAGTGVGTFMGIFTHDYNNMQLDTSNRELIDTHTGVGVSMSIVANRISYAFDFTGPSVTLDTACSSSLVALHLACQSIRNGECEVAIAGGANAILKPEFTIATSKASMLSPDGRCKSFDASANGYVRSEGAGVVILKPLSAAQKDGDSIYAIIKSSVVNQDGKSNGLTVPNQKSQKAALRKALELADVAAEEISYVEAHGTGTFVGDPIEANSIGSVFGENRKTDLVIGSVKSNIGHLEAASGMASLIKVAMSLKNERIPPNIHFKTPNPQIEFDKYHLHVPVVPETWAADPDSSRHACVNSFGFGGTNATIILAESPQRQPSQDETANNKADAASSPFILPLSANTPKALEAVVGRIRNHFETTDDSLSDICFSAATRSGHRDQRVAFIASDKDKMLDLAAQFLEGKDSPFIAKGSNRYAGEKLAFIFSGMGTQWWAMGRQLIAENALFRETIETCDRLLSQHASWSLLEELSRSESDTRINTTQFAQPAIFAVEVALAKLWQSYGIVPDVVCGHSVGEVAAAHISGALSLEDAIKVIFYRSLLQQKTAGMGGMLAVSMPKDHAAQLIEKYNDRVSIAAVNSPSSVTLAGESDALKALEKQLNADNIFCRPLKVEVPFHCVVMDVVKDELISSLQSITPNETIIPLYSTVTGNLISGTQLNADYWWHNVREPVEFAKTIKALEDCDVFLEVGPHPVLTQSMNECLSARKSAIVLGSIKRQQDETAAMFSTLGALHAEGYPVNWAHIVQGQFVKLPKYPWQRQAYWRESEISAQDRMGNMTKRTLLLEEAHPLLGNKIALAQADSIWEAEIQTENLPFLTGHNVHDAIVFPGAGFIEMALAAVFKEGRSAQVIEHFSFEKALVLKEDAVRMQSVLSQNTFSIYSEKMTPGGASTWIKHASVNIAGHHTANESPEFDLADIRQRCTSSKSREEVYEAFTNMGFNYQGDFRGIDNFQYTENEALARIELGSQPDRIYKVYPPLLDNGFQALLGIISCAAGNPVQNRVFLPVQIAKIIVHHRSSTIGTGAWCHAVITESNEQGLKGNLSIYDNNGKLVISIEELFCVSVEKAKWDALLLQNEQDLTSQWFNEIRWMPSTSELETYTVSPRQWIIFGDNAGHGEQLTNKLLEQGHDAFLVSAGTEFRQCSDNNFQISAGQPNDFRELLKLVKDAGSSAGIVYLWPLDVLPLGQSYDSTCGCGTLLYLIQALNSLNLEIPLWIVTQGGQFIYPEASRLEQSPMWGFAQVISLEQPQLQCRCIDLDPEVDTAGNASFLLQVLNSDSKESRLAFRNGEAHTARLVPSQFAIDKSANDDGSSISAEATYLITGAFGGLGRLVSQRLVANGALYLVLMGRNGATGNEDFVADLGRAGVTLHVAAADVSVREDVERVINDIKKTMPPLRGAIHAAGVLDDGVITQQSPERFEKIMKPKVQGSWNLHELTLDLPLDFFVCFSSVASLVGSPGQSNYAAGNAFMDLLAHSRQSMGLPALSINWGPWVGEGMAATQLKRLESKGFGAIEIEPGLQAFEQLIGEPNIAQIGVAPINWETFFSAFPEHKNSFFSKFIEKSTIEESGPNDFLKQLKEVIEAEQHQFLLKHIEDVVNAVFGYSSSESTDRQKSLFDNGLDSLMALEIKNRLESSLRMPLQSTLLFEHPTVESLGDFLSQQIGLSTASQSDSASEVDELLHDLDSLTDEELSALLENELSEIING